MAAQVLVRELTFGNRDGDVDPPHLNKENIYFEDILCHLCHRIVSPNNTPFR